MCGSSMPNSHIPNRLLHAQKRYGNGGAFSGRGMGSQNTTQLMF